MLKIAILASTNGTSSQRIIDDVKSGQLAGVEIACFVCNKECGALERAKREGIEALLIPSKGKEREEFDKEVDAALRERGVELIMLIGYMRFLSKWFVDKWENKIMNCHPSLLPAFAGGMDKNVHEEVLKAGVKKTGDTVHFVDEGADTGPIIAQREVEIVDGETVDSLKEKVQKVEQDLLVYCIEKFRDRKISVDGHKVTVAE